MDEEQPHEKRCGSQHFSDCEPSNTWDAERWGDYAKEQYQDIVAGEKELTPAYWRLGQGLQFARRQFSRGQWGKYLDQLGIDKTRASKAMAIYGAFSNVNQVVGLSVEDAYGRRERRQVGPRRKSSRRSKERSCTLQAFLDRVPREVERWIDDAVGIQRVEARHLLSVVTLGIQQLEVLRSFLQEKVDLPVEDAEHATEPYLDLCATGTEKCLTTRS